MTDAIGEGSSTGRRRCWGAVPDAGAPIKIMWSLGRQMRQIYSARLALEQGKGPSIWRGCGGLSPIPRRS